MQKPVLNGNSNDNSSSPEEAQPKENTEPVKNSKGTLEGVINLEVVVGTGTKPSKLGLSDTEDMVPVVAFKERRYIHSVFMIVCLIMSSEVMYCICWQARFGSFIQVPENSDRHGGDPVPSANWWELILRQLIFMLCRYYTQVLNERAHGSNVRSERVGWAGGTPIANHHPTPQEMIGSWETVCDLNHEADCIVKAIQ